MKTIQIGENEKNMRLDRFLSKLLTNASSGFVYKALRKKQIKVNGRRCTDGSLRLSVGDQLELYIQDSFFSEQELPHWAKGKPKLSVVYEDAHILVMHKPSGLCCQAEDPKPSLEADMRGYLYEKGELDLDRQQLFLPSLCHRIDRNTEGLVLGAKDRESLQILNEKIKKKELKKFYLCETMGVPQPKQGVLQGWLKKDETNHKMVALDKPVSGGLAYSMGYRVLRNTEETALVEVELYTGRTHQIRAGFAKIGHPLRGDVKYGAPKDGGKGFQHLLAHRLVFAFETEAGCLAYLDGQEIVLPQKAWKFD